MKLSINGIKNTTDWEKAGIKLPSYDVEKVAEDTKKSPVWVHFGIGNIFRIFIGGIADSLLEQGVSDKGISKSSGQAGRKSMCGAFFANRRISSV